MRGDGVAIPCDNCKIDHAAGSKFHDKNAKESWEIIENLVLYEYEGWNDPRDFAKLVKKREEINDIMAKMFGLLKELTTSMTPEKVLVRDEASSPITKCVNVISLVKMEKDKSIKNNEVVDNSIVEPSELNVVEPIKLVDWKNEMEDGADDKSVKSVKEELTGWETKACKMDYETYNLLPAGPMYNVILKKKLAKKDDIEGNFVIPCSIGRLKYVNALIDQGSDVNVMTISIYNRLTNKKLVGTDIRLSLASHSYIYPLGIAEDVLIDIVGYVYLVDFVILDIEEDKSKPFILGTPFLTTAKTEIRFDKGTITLKS
ncbi:MAK10-like protein, partial [Tanacetum coccineum]